MAEGQGKYDDLCSYVRENARAQLAVVIVFGGAEGDGFSIQMIDPTIGYALPKILRHIADEIEQDMKRQTS